MRKKGQLGLNTVISVAVAILFLAVITIAIFLTLTALKESDVAKESKSGTANNQSTIVVMNESTEPIILQAYTNYTDYEPTCTIAHVLNATNNVVIGSNNYSTNTTFGGCEVAPATGIGLSVNNTIWTISYTFNYKDNSKTQDITYNISTGLTTFFNSTGTIFSILVVVVIILAITLIILAVRRFGGGSGGSL